MKTLTMIAVVLAAIGALNWGLVGLFEFDLVAAIFGDMSMLTRTVYALVGLSGLWVVLQLAMGRLLTTDAPTA